MLAQKTKERVISNIPTGRFYNLILLPVVLLLVVISNLPHCVEPTVNTAQPLPCFQLWLFILSPRLWYLNFMCPCFPPHKIAIGTCLLHRVNIRTSVNVFEGPSAAPIRQYVSFSTVNKRRTTKRIKLSSAIRFSSLSHVHKSHLHLYNKVITD